jgi:PIN domain nuclease of toxin-antitoxin system
VKCSYQLSAISHQKIVLEAEALYGIPERGDRLIAATAASLGCPLMTSDSHIAHQGIRTIW